MNIDDVGRFQGDKRWIIKYHFSHEFSNYREFIHLHPKFDVKNLKFDVRKPKFDVIPPKI